MRIKIYDLSFIFWCSFSSFSFRFEIVYWTNVGINWRIIILSVYKYIWIYLIVSPFGKKYIFQRKIIFNPMFGNTEFGHPLKYFYCTTYMEINTMSFRSLLYKSIYWRLTVVSWYLLPYCKITTNCHFDCR